MAEPEQWNSRNINGASRGLLIIRLLTLPLSIVVVGALGYHYLLGWPWLEALYMTVITITTVGFGEVEHLNAAGRLFTMFLVLASVGIVAYSATTMTSLVVETRFSAIFWKRRMAKQTKRMQGHFLVCGYGRTGRSVSRNFELARLEHVIVESSPTVIEELRQQGKTVIDGDASDDAVLQAAGIDKAKGVVAALGNDAENVYLVLSARQLNPKLNIVSWASSEEAEVKIRRAGADHVLSPYVLGGKRIATLITAPHALEFFDHALGGGLDHEIRIAEIPVHEGSKLIGNSLQGLGVRRDLAVIVIGIRKATGKIQFNPAADTLLEEEDILIGIGEESQIEKFRALGG